MRKKLFAASACAVACSLAALGVVVFSSPAAVPSALARTRGTAEQHVAARAALTRMLRSSHAAFMVSGAASRKGMPSSYGKGRTTGGRTGGDNTDVSSVTSINWSGYALGDGVNGDGAAPQHTAFTNVSGTWTVPPTTCNTRELRFDSDWVGLDGLNDDTVEQLGTTAYCYLGKAYYTAWIEMFPAPSEPPANPITVEPGQSITASVTRTAHKYTLTLTDDTTRQHFTQTETVASICASSAATCPLNASAEWVVERPAFPSTFGYQIVPLAPFRSPIAFTTVQASAFGKKSSGPLTFERTTTVWAINIASSGLNTTTPPKPLYDLDTTSNLRGGNSFSRSSKAPTSSSFSCTWLNSY